MTDRGWNLIGWWLFIACALLFIAASARAGDMLALAGSVAFMAANLAFLVPYYRHGARRETEEDAT